MPAERAAAGWTALPAEPTALPPQAPLTWPWRRTGDAAARHATLPALGQPTREPARAPGSASRAALAASPTWVSASPTSAAELLRAGLPRAGMVPAETEPDETGPAETEPAETGLQAGLLVRAATARRARRAGAVRRPGERHSALREPADRTAEVAWEQAESPRGLVSGTAARAVARAHAGPGPVPGLVRVQKPGTVPDCGHAPEHGPVPGRWRAASAATAAAAA